MVWALEPTVKREEEMMDTRIGWAGLSDREACSTAQKQCLYTVAQGDRVIVLNKKLGLANPIGKVSTEEQSSGHKHPGVW